MKDLLCSEKPIDIIEKDGAVVPKEALHIDIMSGGDIIEAARRLQRERRLGETRMNKQSSRSHTILRMAINTIEEDDTILFEEASEEDLDCSRETTRGNRIISAVVNLVDLAGSEKASQTGASGERFREAGHINTSLSALSKVVSQLGKQYKQANKRKTSSIRHRKSRMSFNQGHVNYWESKLTRLLQSSLAGDASIVFICNATPASSEETLSTLRLF